MRLRTYIVSLLVLLFSMQAVAQRYGSRNNKSHWVGVSLAGFEATPVQTKKSDVTTRTGGGGQAALLYEVHLSQWFVNVGVGADYTVVGCGMKDRSDAFDRTDFTGEPVLYRYVYSDWKEQQSQLRLIVPVHVGYYIGDWLYAALGATFRAAPLMSRFDTKTRMLTEGEYARFIQPVRNADAYGYWREADYSGSGKVQSATHEMAVEAEFGVRVPIARKVQMRAGVFIGYDVPLMSYESKRADTPAADYGKVDTNPFTQSQANLAQSLTFHSLFDSPEVNKDLQRLRAGVRVTFLLDVTHTSHKCMCMQY